jgi:hypothetical protein
MLEGFFAASYQASMLREEERQVVFRAVLAEPALFDPDGRPPEGLQTPTVETFHFYGICRQKREPTSGLEPLTCSLRVINRVLQGFA